jgi:pimeloyl-ACP methyl ester carboxylesterase
LILVWCGHFNPAAEWLQYAGEDIWKNLVERMVQVGEVALNYAQGPDTGTPLVMIHGGAVRWQDFLPIRPALAARWQVYALDLRGHGRSGWSAQDYRLDDYAAGLCAFLEGCVARPAMLVARL